MGNALLDFYKERDLMDEARKLFDEMPELDCLSYNIVITGYAWNGKYKSSLDLVYDLQFKRFANRRQLPFATMLNVAGSITLVKMGQKIHSQAIVMTAILETRGKFSRRYVCQTDMF